MASEYAKSFRCGLTLYYNFLFSGVRANHAPPPGTIHADSGAPAGLFIAVIKVYCDKSANK